jgi:hypothetical protein
MTEHLEAVTIIAVQSIVGTDPYKASFVLRDAVDFIVGKTTAGIYVSKG